MGKNKALLRRTCLGCRKVNEKKSLVRFVINGYNAVLIDGACVLPGRGYYFCPDTACVDAMAKRRYLEKVLKIRETGPFYAAMRKHVTEILNGVIY